MLTLHARQEPTRDVETLRLWPHSKSKDTVLYTDAALTTVKAIIPWFHKNRPVSRRTCMLNCYRWELVWHPTV